MAHALRRARLTAATASVIVTLPSLLAGWGAPAMAIPQLDLKAYPPAAAGQTRWVIQLPGVLPPGTDPRLSPHPSDWRVQLIPGREVKADCNQQAFRGRFRASKLKDLGVSVYTVSDVGPMVTTLMACPPGQAKRSVFVPMGSRPFVVPYDASRPIVVYTPKDLQLRWRLWKAEKVQQPAQAL
ncbi:ecotin family protein [Cyanobium sp. Aljojuca 7A6]|nr:ecotin family protein [Cyanobium sp. La Preciosa 7G6]MCP9938101.1 ecotin family protein [Cyanobium sp. Aljojuca 7A6]